MNNIQIFVASALIFIFALLVEGESVNEYDVSLLNEISDLKYGVRNASH